MIGVSEGMISYLVNGKRKPTPALALRIENATNGKIGRLALLYRKDLLT